jgi:hypothetical protein
MPPRLCPLGQFESFVLQLVGLAGALIHQHVSLPARSAPDFVPAHDQMNCVVAHMCFHCVGMALADTSRHLLVNIARPTRAVSTTIRPPPRLSTNPWVFYCVSPDLRSVHSYGCCAHHLIGMFLQVCRASHALSLRTAFTFFSPPSCMRAMLVEISILVGGSHFVSSCAPIMDHPGSIQFEHACAVDAVIRMLAREGGEKRA